MEVLLIGIGAQCRYYLWTWSPRVNSPSAKVHPKPLNAKPKPLNPKVQDLVDHAIGVLLTAGMSSPLHLGPFSPRCVIRLGFRVQGFRVQGLGFRV